MQAFAIVEVDVVGDVGHGLFQSLEFLEVHHFGLETAEEGFHVGIVPAVALATHADAQPGLFKRGTILLAGVL